MTTASHILRNLGRTLGRQGAGYAGQKAPPPDTSLMPLVLDAPLPIAPTSSQVDSLLLLPMGSGLVVDQLVQGLSALGNNKVIVMPPQGQQPSYKDRVDPDVLQRLRILDPNELRHVLSKCEATDYLVIIDPRYWPVVGFDFQFIAEQARCYQGSTHAIAVGGSEDGTRERVEYDAEGRIRRVQRLYSPMSWPATTAATAFCSVVPARAVCDMTIRHLGELRRELVDRGVLAQDLPVLSDVDTLTSPAGILACSQRMLGAMLSGPIPADLRMHGPGVLVGDGCRIDPTVRLVPPVLIQDYVTIEREAMVVGPAVIGSGSTLGNRTVVAQSIVLPGSHIAHNAAISNTISGSQTGAQQETATAETAEPAASADLKVCDWQSKEMTLQDLPRRHLPERTIKRAMDIVLAGGGLLLLSPLLAAVAILVKYTSPGPIFFVHRREGVAGRPFGCIKFRTMVADAHARQRELYKQNEVDGPQFKMDNDPRVTPLGNWLRALNIDELPQLFNVLMGQMSLVGPRPSPFRENQICVAWRRARLSVRPGITGLWQICRDRRCDGDFHQWIYYDITYVRHFSLWLDVKILLHTVLSAGGRKRVRLERLLKNMEIMR